MLGMLNYWIYHVGEVTGEWGVGCDIFRGLFAAVCTYQYVFLSLPCRPRTHTNQVRNELTSAEFALNLNGAVRAGSSSRSTANPTTPVTNNDKTASTGGPAASSSSSSSSTVAGVGAGSKTEIDYDSIAERLEASLRALQAGRPLSLGEAVTQDEVKPSLARGKKGGVGCRRSTVRSTPE